MSHFTVTVRLTSARLARHHGNMDAALNEMMEPFNEATKKDEFRVFKDMEDEYREEYESKSTGRIRTPQGELVSPWDERFRVPGSFGSGTNTHKAPADCDEVQVPFKTLYATFEQFAKDWHGSKRDPNTGRHGYWRNNEAKWDWWSIGGRWMGFYPLKTGRNAKLGRPGTFDNKPEEGHGDVVHVGDIDMDLVATQTRERAEKFWTEWETFLKDPSKGNSYDGPRSRAMSIGLLDVVQGPAESNETQVAISWAKTGCTDDRRTWHDVAKIVTREEFLRDYLDSFTSIVTYAALDDNGWHASGEMGWFGVDRSESGEKVAFQKGFLKNFILSADPTDTFVLLDCHI